MGFGQVKHLAKLCPELQNQSWRSGWQKQAEVVVKSKSVFWLAKVFRRRFFPNKSRWSAVRAVREAVKMRAQPSV
jgi:hypothetical protein